MAAPVTTIDTIPADGFALIVQNPLQDSKFIGTVVGCTIAGVVMVLVFNLILCWGSGCCCFGRRRKRAQANKAFSSSSSSISEDVESNPSSQASLFQDKPLPSRIQGPAPPAPAKDVGQVSPRTQPPNCPTVQPMRYYGPAQSRR